LLVVGQQNDTVWKSVRNLRGVHTTLAHQLNAYDLLDCEQLLLTQEGLDRVKEVFAK
jgi:large subunit ribosomal protein L4